MDSVTVIYKLPLIEVEGPNKLRKQIRIKLSHKHSRASNVILENGYFPPNTNSVLPTIIKSLSQLTVHTQFFIEHVLCSRTVLSLQNIFENKIDRLSSLDCAV